MPTLNVKPYVGGDAVAINTMNDNGRAAASASQSTAWSTEDKAVADAIKAAVEAMVVGVSVSGTVAATQSGTWNINNVSGTVSLPTGASTAAKQPALGVAGTASSDVITVQGIAGMTALKVDGSAVTQPISGTVAATQSGTWTIAGISGTISLPTGASTSALQTTGNSTLTSIDGHVNTMDTNLATLAGTVASARVNVTLATLPSLAAGSALVGSVKISDGTSTATVRSLANNALNVALTSTGGAHIGDVLALTGIGDSTGALRVTVANDSGGVTEVYGLGENNAAALSTTMVPVMSAIALSSDPSWSNNLGVVLRTTLSGDLAVTLAGETVTVGSHDVTNAGTFAVQVNGAALTSLQLIDDAIATTASAITTKGMAASGTDGTNARILKTDTNGELQIDVLSIAAGDNNIGNVDIVTMPNVTLAAGTNTNEMVGDAAHDAAIAGNPVRIGGRALTTDYTAVAAGDTADIATTLTGKQLTYPFALPGQTWNYAAASGGITNTTGVTIKAAAGAGVRNYITCLTIVNGHASVGTDVQIRDGASGTVLYRFYAVANGGGVREVFSVPIRGSANTLLEVACGTTGAAVYVDAQGFTAAE